MNFIVCAFVFALPVSAKLRGETGFLASSSMVMQSFDEVVNGAVGSHRSVVEERRARHERGLAPLFAVLPKNSHGLLDHNTVRYGLHRYFSHSRGMSVTGLTPAGATHNYSKTSVSQFISEEDVPRHFQLLFEERTKGGLDFKNFALLASVIEHFVFLEEASRLQKAYKLAGVEDKINKALTPAEQEKVVLSHMGLFISSSDHHENMTALTHYLEEEMRVDTADLKHFLLTHAPPTWQEANFDYMKKLIEEVMTHWMSHQDSECRGIAKLLLEKDVHKIGRVSMKAFKAAGDHFTEDAGTLRYYGAYDETSRQVVIPNYMLAHFNCRASSSIFAVCCLNPCEDIMLQVEEKVKAPAASADELVKVISEVSAQTSPAPRRISSQLVDRLREVAAHHGNKVPLHGRLFGQWLHHVFPRECPFPMRSHGNAMTGEDWFQEDEHEEEQEEEDVYDQVLAKDLSDNGVAHTVPWYTEEELIFNDIPKRSLGHEVGVLIRACAGIAALAAFAYVVTQSLVASTKPVKMVY